VFLSTVLLTHSLLQFVNQYLHPTNPHTHTHTHTHAHTPTPTHIHTPTSTHPHPHTRVCNHDHPLVDLPVVVVEDSARRTKLGRDHRLEHVSLPFDSGLSACRNHALSLVRTPFFLLLDDDFVFDHRTRFVHLTLDHTSSHLTRSHLISLDIYLSAVVWRICTPS
jgi:hypothetical protein